jgi:hypothetical protein
MGNQTTKTKIDLQGYFPLDIISIIRQYISPAAEIFHNFCFSGLDVCDNNLSAFTIYFFIRNEITPTFLSPRDYVPANLQRFQEWVFKMKPSILFEIITLAIENEDLQSLSLLTPSKRCKTICDEERNSRLEERKETFLSSEKSRKMDQDICSKFASLEFS